MPYASIPHRRMAYDIDGSAMGWVKNGSYSSGIQSWCPSSLLGELNDDDVTTAIDINNAVTETITFWLFFPEVREIEAVSFSYWGGKEQYFYELQGSIDSTNGLDGTWETAVWPSTPPLPGNTGVEWWRTGMVPCSFSGPKKTLRWKVGLRDYVNLAGIIGWHFYGRKAAGETQDDLIFVDAATNLELTALVDWGDRPEGTTEYKQIKVKNTSPDKTANSINLQLNDGDFLLSWNSNGPWTATLDITSLGVGAESAPIYIKNELGPPNLMLGPRSARIIASIGSWT